MKSSVPGSGTAVDDALMRVTEVVRTVVRGPDLTNYDAQGVTPQGLDQAADLDVRSTFPTPPSPLQNPLCCYALPKH